MATTTTEFKNPDGVKVQIIVSLREDRGKATYPIRVCYKEPGQRAWRFSDETTNDGNFRKLPFGGDEQEKYVLSLQMKYATEAQIKEARLNHWKSLEPK